MATATTMALSMFFFAPFITEEQGTCCFMLGFKAKNVPRNNESMRVTRFHHRLVSGPSMNGSGKVRMIIPIGRGHVEFNSENVRGLHFVN